MNVLDAIKNRREITNFKDEPIQSDLLEAIVDAAYLAPSGNNLPSKDIIVVTEKEKLQVLAKTTPFMKWLEQAPAAIVITGRPDVSKYWLQDASIAAAFAWLETVEADIGAAFGAVYHAQDQQESEKRESHVKQNLDIPNDRKVVAVLGLGYPDQEPKPKKYLPKDELVHYNQFQS
ncbi:nitroreductase family protein [Aquibacillus sediminis]|uniref:nitroreductase family protein n=1 Tax=Aquibacillus sediminis TaxID=2574734 RepID=UPI00110842D1|nr:nitroreductase family protein [Aquibacillus sediminis]